MEGGDRGTPGEGGVKGPSAGVTSEGIDEQADEHGEHRDGDPVGEALVAHAAVDGHAGLVALQGTGGSARAPSTHNRLPTHWCPVLLPLSPWACALAALQPPLVTATGPPPAMPLKGMVSPWFGVPAPPQ